MPAGVGSAGKETESVHEVSQEELVKRDTLPGATCGGAGGFLEEDLAMGSVCLMDLRAVVVFAYLAHVVAALAAEVFLVRFFLALDGCECAALAGGVLGRRKTFELRRQVIEVDHDSSFACHFQPCMSPIDRHRFVSDALHGRCTSYAALGGTNPCRVVHINSCGTRAHGISRLNRGREDLGGMKTFEYEYLELAPLQQASGSLHDEAWAGRVVSPSLRISQEVEIESGCEVTVCYLPSLDFWYFLTWIC